MFISLKKIITFIFTFFVSTLVFSATRGAQELVPAGSWVYESFNKICIEQSVVNFSDSTPISIQQLKFYMSEINYDSLSSVGKAEYDKLINYFKIPKVTLKDYDDVTATFDEVFSPVAGRSNIVNNDIVKKDSNSLILNECIDFDLLISSVPNEMVNSRCFSSDIKELINSLAFTYNIDDQTMIGLVRDSINEKCMIDRVFLRKSCRNYYQFEEAGRLPTLVYNKQPEYLKKPEGDMSKWARMVYTFENISPYDFLKAKYKGVEPTSRDLKLVENLLIDQKLQPGVVNVLLAYVLKINNQKLNKNYIETIVGQWKRLNIETVEDAMNITLKEHKKLKKIMSKDPKIKPRKDSKESLPAWFDKDIDKVNPTDSEKEELDNILKELV